MYQNKKIAVIIAAAGSGSRMGGGICKQFRQIEGVPILSAAMRAFEDHPFIDDIFVVTREDSLKLCREEMIAPFGFTKVRGVLAGGETRQDSVYSGLLALGENTDLVLVHDGARPFVSADVISDTIKTAAERGAAVAAVPVKDTVKVVEFERREDAAGVFVCTPERSKLYAVQTPQAFSVPILREAMECAFAENFYGTDDSVLVERLGKKVYLVKSENENIKLTTAEDMEIGAAIARRIAARRKDGGAPIQNTGRNGDCEMGEKHRIRVGTGFDVHQVTEGRRLILGGVEIPWEKGLLGHSDADVLIHALMDALLGAAALGDIGRHFPDNDESYKDISSLALLERVSGLLSENGYAVGNADVVLIAQRPKIAPFIPQMRENIAEALKISADCVSIKGTTTEGLGFCGRGEGMAAQAAAVIYPL